MIKSTDLEERVTEKVYQRLVSDILSMCQIVGETPSSVHQDIVDTIPSVPQKGAISKLRFWLLMTRKKRRVH